MDVLEIRNVSKSYANHVALRDVNISVPEGSIFGLLGPNGAGKTSLIRIINQITGPDTGEILFRGEPIKRDHISAIGYLPEERGLYKKMKVGEQAVYLARLKGLSHAEAISRLKMWFEKFEMTSWWNKKIEELSKGMAQKVQFIVTVVHNPHLLILDEPFSGFDPLNASLIRDEILELKKEGKTIIFSTHNMASVEELCDEIALINHSKVILKGSVRDVRDQYRSNTFRIIYKGQAIAFANALWTGAELLKNEALEDGTNEALVKLVNNTSINQILGTLLPHVAIISLNELLPGMNEIFIAKVKELHE